METVIDAIRRVASQNGNVIRYFTVIGMLEEKKEKVTEREIEAIIGELASLGISIKADDDEDYEADNPNTGSFIPAEVNIGSTNSTVSNLLDRLYNGEINLNPSFQRHRDLWSEEKQSQLIESLMLKIPIPAFYFDVADESEWVVIDGLQRLSAFQNYLLGKRDEEGNYEQKRLVGLQYLRDFENFTFDELPRQYIRRIRETPIIMYIVNKGTPDEIVFNIFQRINTGGLELNSQEIRQALYQGAATELIERMANSEEFMLATQGAVASGRMLDREYATRYLAFTELDYTTEYKGNMDAYLIRTLKKVNQYEKERIVQIESKFKRIMRCCHSLFGKFAFRKYDINKNYRRSPINKAIYELWSICLFDLSEKEGLIDKLLEKKDIVLVRFGDLLKDEKFESDIRSGDPNALQRRIAIAKRMIQEVLNA